MTEDSIKDEVLLVMKELNTYLSELDSYGTITARRRLRALAHKLMDLSYGLPDGNRSMQKRLNSNRMVTWSSASEFQR